MSLAATLAGPALADPPGPITDPRFLEIERTGCAPRSVAQNESSPSPAPSASPAATASPAASPAPTPSPSASLIPLPRPPLGPGVLIPPTPQPSGPAPPTIPPAPTPSAPGGSPAPVFLVRPSGAPSLAPARSNASPSPEPTANGPTPIPTLGPYQIVTIADHLTGSTTEHQPADLVGNVHVFYEEGQIVGDRAHWDGDHTLTITGHTYLLNRNQDAVLYADSIVFDTQTRKATLENGSGETTEGVQQGKLHYTAQELTARSNGVSHGEHASFTTCENPHGGYHVEARSIDVFPGDKLVARKAVVFLGPLAIFYLPLLVIPLKSIQDPRRKASFLPIIGYDQVEGFYVKARIGFGTTDTYYGYYRVEYFTKRGLGLGYVAFIGTKTGRRYITIDSYTISDRIQDARETNFNLQETENFSSRLRGQFGVNYQGDFGPNFTLPASLNIQGSVVHQGVASNENLTFSRYTQGSLSDNLNLAFLDTLSLSRLVQQQINLSYSKFNSPLAASDTLHINTDTHYFSQLADFDLIYDKTDYSAQPAGYDRVPELDINPHINFHNYRFPFQVQFAIGDFNEPQNHFNTTRAEMTFNQPVNLTLFGSSSLSANYNLIQDYYATGDEKAFETQNITLSTPIGQHIVNTITYNEQHPFGPADVPFQELDRLTGATKFAQDVLRFYNRDIYSLSLSTGTGFDRMAQPIQYQLTARPSPRSYLVIGGFWTPGPGQGFGLTNVQTITPFGRDTTLQFSTNIDWKNKGRLVDKNVYLSKIIGNCYDLQVSYNQDLRQVTFNVIILAFPGQGAGFGLGGQQTSIIPQNFGL